MTKDNIPNRGGAEHYDVVASSALHPFDDVMITRIRTLLPRPKSLDPCALDVGTATARLPILMALDPFFRDFRFVASDLFPDMVEVARQHVREQGLEQRIRAVIADGQDLPFGDGTFDVVFCRATLHHFKVPATALREMYRVLAAGGIAIIHDLRRDAPTSVLKRLNDAMAKDGYGPTNLTEKFTLDEARGIIVDAGLAERATLSTDPSEERQLGFEIVLTKPGPAVTMTRE